MMKLLDAADIYLSRCKWQDMALLKCCLCAMGIIFGMSLPKKGRKFFWIVAPLVFVVTCVPLMMKFADAYKEVKN